METRDFIQSVGQEVERIKDDFGYANLGDAFVHWCIAQNFELSGDEIEEACEIAGKNEKGIDAFWHDDVERCVYIVQGTYSKTGRKRADRGKITEFTSAIPWLENPGSGVKQAVIDAASIYKDKVSQGYIVKMIFVIFGELKPGAQEEVDQFNRTPPRLNHELDLWKLTTLKEKYEENLSVQAEKGPDVDLNLVPNEHFDVPSPYPAIIASVFAKEIAKLRRDYKLAIFHRNVRYYLGTKTSVAESIKNTLDQPREKENFWYYNNGLSITCDMFELRTPNKLFVKNLQIVNGVQTASVLYERIAQVDENVKLVVKITKASGDLPNKVAMNNNRQNPITTRDLLSNDAVQVGLKNMFANLSPPWFYETKRKEWASLSTPTKRRFKAQKKYRMISNDTAGQAYLSFKKFRPHEAKSSKSKIFVYKSEGGFYDDIFNSSTIAEDLLLPSQFLSRIDEEIRKFKRKYKEAEKNNFASLNSQEADKLKRKEFLKHANLTLLAMAGYLVRDKYGDSCPSREILLRIEPRFDEIFRGIFDYVVETLDSKIWQENMERKEKGEWFSIRNYFAKPGTINGIFENLRLDMQREKRRGRDPLNLLPE